MKFMIWQDASLRFILLILVTPFLLARCGTGDASKDTNYHTATAVISVSDGPLYDFGIQPVNSQTDKEFTITNLGAERATNMDGSFYLSVSYAFKDGSYPGTGGTCGTTLEKATTCTIVVTFTPKYIGVTESTINISYFNGSANVTTMNPTLHGQGG